MPHNLFLLTIRIYPPRDSEVSRDAQGCRDLPTGASGVQARFGSPSNVVKVNGAARLARLEVGTTEDDVVRDGCVECVVNDDRAELS